MNTQVIINKLAGFVPPRSYIQAVLKHCPDCYGISIQDKDGDTPILDVVTAPDKLDADKVMAILDGIKDLPAVLCFGTMTQDFNKEDDLQPFNLEQAGAGEGDDPEKILSIFVEGDLPNYSKPGEGHTEAYHFWEDFLFPTLEEKLQAAADLPSFYDKLKTSAFKQAIENPFGHRGVVVLVPLEGDIIAFGKNEIGGEFPWGTTSNVFDWKGDEAVAAKPGIVAKAKSRLAAITGAATATAPASAIKTDDNGVHHVGNTTIVDVEKAKDSTAISSTVVPAAPKAGFTKVTPPAKLQGNARNAWIRLFTGQHEGPMPVGHNNKAFEVEVSNDILEFALRDVSTKDQVKSLSKEVGRKQKPIANSAVAAAVKTAEKVNDDKSTIQDPNKKPAEQPAGDKRPPSDFLPEMSADVKKGTVDLVTDWATRPTEKMPSALEIQRIEAKWPIFTEMMGIKKEDICNWTIADVKELCKKYPDAAALVIIQLKNIGIAAGGFNLPMGKPVASGQPPIVPEKKQVEVQPAAPAVPAATSTKKTSRLARITGQAA